MMKIKMFIRRALFVAMVITFVSPLSGQDPDTLQNLPNLLLPKFTKGIVKLKNGKTYTAVLNYETVEQEMVFLQRNLTIVLDDPKQVDTIYLANKVFIPFDKGFYELVYAAPITLFIQHKSFVEYVGTPIGYGAMSQTTAPSYVRQVFDRRGAISLKVPDTYKVTDDTDYWIRWKNGWMSFSTKKQFLGIFEDNDKLLSEFIRKNKTDFKSTNDLKKLMVFTNELYKGKI